MRGEFPVVEVFGPTLQGEGPLAGTPTMFVRFAGCDYRCSWCDSMHAVDPRRWARTAPRFTAVELLDELELLGGNALWVTLSGGNPALYDLGGFCDLLRQSPYCVAVETQGSKWKPWLGQVDMLVVSPKPPSSGMAIRAEQHVEAFLDQAEDALPASRRALKVVIRDADDLQWAKRFVTGVRRRWPFYLSVCSPVPGYDWPQPSDERELRLEVAGRYERLAGMVLDDPVFAGAVCLPQLHVIAWGSKLGV